jgi:hypothetical protein
MKVVLVTTPSGKRLVRAKSEKAARDFVVQDTVKTVSLNAASLVDYMANGYVVEDAELAEEISQESAPDADDVPAGEVETDGE